MFQGEQGNRLVGRSWATEEIDPTSLRPCRLICEKGHRPSSVQHFQNLIVAAVLWDDVLAGGAAKAFDEVVQIGIIKGSGDTVRRESEQAEAALRLEMDVSPEKTALLSQIVSVQQALPQAGETDFDVYVAMPFLPNAL